MTQETVDTARVALLQAQATLSSPRPHGRPAAGPGAHRDQEPDRRDCRRPLGVGRGVVTANQTEALTTVTRLDPIYVDVGELGVRIQRVRDRTQQGTLKPGDRAG